jgi:hypothetical protein
MIVGNMIGGCPASPKTCVFLTNSGKEIQAILVESETVFTAKADDVRKGKTFASDIGVGVGTATIVDCDYIYAYVDSNTGICLGILVGNTKISDSHFVEVAVYDKEYSGKYYNNGAWYEDAAGTIPWTSSLV